MEHRLFELIEKNPDNQSERIELLVFIMLKIYMYIVKLHL